MKERIQHSRLNLSILFVLLAGSIGFVQAQSGPLTLQQCIQTGLTNNPGVLKSKLEIDRTTEVKNEARAAYLPQVNGTVQMQDNLKLQTSILPGEIFGQPGTKVAVQFGTTYNISAGVDAKQVLYDQSMIYALKLTQGSTRISEISAKKTEEQLIYDIASAYYAAQVSYTQKKLVESNLAQVDTLLQLTKIQFENDIAKQLDVDRLTVNFTNLQTELANSTTNYEKQLMLLKYYMGVPLESAIELPVITGNEPSSALIDITSLNNTDIELIQAQREVNSVTMKQIKAGYLPSLSMTFHSAYQIQQNDLRIFSQNATWFPNAYIGLNLNVPIFDGLSKNARVKQTDIKIRQSILDEQYLTESLKMQRANANNSMTSNKAALESQQRNIELAKKVYETTQSQFVGGIATMTDLVNAETSLRDAQTNYLRALVNVKLSELDLIKTTGNIGSLN